MALNFSSYHIHPHKEKLQRQLNALCGKHDAILMLHPVIDDDVIVCDRKLLNCRIFQHTTACSVWALLLCCYMLSFHVPAAIYLVLSKMLLLVALLLSDTVNNIDVRAPFQCSYFIKIYLYCLIYRCQDELSALHATDGAQFFAFPYNINHPSSTVYWQAKDETGSWLNGIEYLVIIICFDTSTQ